MRVISIALLAGIVACAAVRAAPAADAAGFKVVWSFSCCKDGAVPLAGLIDVQGTLYGTTEVGGAGRVPVGSVFAINRKSDVETVIYSFCRPSGCPDGEYPEAALIDVNGTLYGTTMGGGANTYYGTAFALDPQTGAETVLYSFCSRQNCTDGANPEASLIAVNGTLYGTTYEGGGNGGGRYGGTVFSLDITTGVERVLHSFCSQQNCTDGANPAAGLIDVNGKLYGTTSYGGTGSEGTVFALKLQ